MNKPNSSGKLNRRQVAMSLLAGAVTAPLLGEQITTNQAPKRIHPTPNPTAAARNAIVPKPPELPPEVPPFGESMEFVRQIARKRVMAFPMEQVRITGGPFQEAESLELAYLKRLDSDRLLHNFRVNAGIPSSAQPLGGWEKPDCEVRGHFVGHFLSACALMHASTGDVEIKAKGDSIVANLAECQTKLGGGYLGAFPAEYVDRLKIRRKIWAPFYTFHKILAGMLDMSQHCGNRQALQVAKGMAMWADNWSSSVPEPQMQQILEIEYGGMNEALYNLALITGKDHYAVVGDRFTKKRFFNPLALRRDELRGLHVNTHIPQVIGAARRYTLERPTLPGCRGVLLV